MLEGIFQPVVEGDVSLAILIDGLEVFLALGDTSLSNKLGSICIEKLAMFDKYRNFKLLKTPNKLLQP